VPIHGRQLTPDTESPRVIASWVPRSERDADFLVAEVGGCRGEADLVLFERLAGECGVAAGVEGLRGPAGQGEGAVVLLLRTGHPERADGSLPPR
jgi:hypothetical protein